MASNVTTWLSDEIEDEDASQLSDHGTALIPTSTLRPDNHPEVEIVESSQSQSVPVPAVVKFVNGGFQVKGNKWSAKCTRCNTTLTENRNVTSAFTKLVCLALLIISEHLTP